MQPRAIADRFTSQEYFGAECADLFQLSFSQLLCASKHENKYEIIWTGPQAFTRRHFVKYTSSTYTCITRLNNGFSVSVEHWAKSILCLHCCCLWKLSQLDQNVSKYFIFPLV